MLGRENSRTIVGTSDFLPFRHSLSRVQLIQRTVSRAKRTARLHQLGA